ncbi:helix-turn-helix transcriptional regulator [Acetivibrio sp. MSJd-27]|uniref:helix-turn-helix domain-containing protein n=1 Tax=Acetivibrio sp. MSJd-27 TaxID=2841523 RepID=UPI001C0F7B72|nr:helix-turn-helix transcriptional regulator [Acetivibrio sp. MSJd-27]MBU5450257.1 helix-turn-helix transcriptional regulator [Acetivibrio sp. MSJd-27]
MFCDKLSEYMDMLGCSGKEFAEQSGISEATVSRYKSGARTPKTNSEDMKKLCRGICAIAAQKGIDMSYKTVLQELNSLAEITPFDYDSLQTKFNMLCSVFSVNLADMSKSLKYDSSYMSRIKSGKRRPAVPQKFAFDVAGYFPGRCDSGNDKKMIAEMMNIKPDQIKTRNAYLSELTN